MCERRRSKVFPNIKNILIVVLFGTLVSCGGGDSKPKINLQLVPLGQSTLSTDLPTSDRVKPLSAQETVEFVTDQGEALIKHTPGKAFQVGDILVGNEAQRFLVRIKEIKTVGSGETKVVLQQAQMEEIIGKSAEGQVELVTAPVYTVEDLNKETAKVKDQLIKGPEFSEMDLDPQVKPHASFQVDPNGAVSVQNLELFSAQIDDHGNLIHQDSRVFGVPVSSLSFSAGVNDRLQVKGSKGLHKATLNNATIKIHPTFRSSMKWSWGLLRKMATRFDAEVTYKIDITYETSGELKLESLIDFLPTKVIPIRVPGTPPVYVDVEMKIPAGISIEATKQGRTRVIFETSYKFYADLKYNRGEPVAVDKAQVVDVQQKTIVTDEEDAKIVAEFFLKPSIKTRFYRVLGPYAYLRPYVREEIDWPSQSKKDDLYFGVTGGVGVDVSEPVFQKDYFNFDSGDIFNFRQSVDIDGNGAKGQNAQELQVSTNLYDENKVEVKSINDEGFVKFNLRQSSSSSTSNQRFELVQRPQSGRLIPSEHFFMSGILYYYPVKGNPAQEFMVVRVYGKNGVFRDHKIDINISAPVLAEVGKERFANSSNSYSSTYTGGEVRASLVPSVHLGSAPPEPPISVEDCLSNIDVKDYFKLDPDLVLRLNSPIEVPSCFPLMPIVEEYVQFINQDVQSASPGPINLEMYAQKEAKYMKIKKVSDSDGVLVFEYQNLLDFYDYVFTKPNIETVCKKNIKITPIDNETLVGVLIEPTSSCAFIPANPIVMRPETVNLVTAVVGEGRPAHQPEVLMPDPAGGVQIVFNKSELEQEEAGLSSDLFVESHFHFPLATDQTDLVMKSPDIEDYRSINMNDLFNYSFQRLSVKLKLFLKEDGKVAMEVNAISETPAVTAPE